MAQTVPTGQLGRNGPTVPRMGLGLMGLSVFYGPKLPDADRMKLLDAAYERGERFWDSADMYGDSEDLLGTWFKKNPDKRDHIFLATKFGNRGQGVVDSTPEYAHEAIDKSLSRLGLPYVDLYYCHRLDRKTPIEKTIQAMVEEKNKGKFKYLGVSECSAESLRRAHKVHPITAVQIEYSPMTLDIETDQIQLLRTARELGIATVAYSPVGRGLITGAIKSRKDFVQEGDFRSRAPRFSEENFPKNLELVDKISALAHKKGVTPSQLALAWLLAQGDDIFPIPGTTKIHRLDENLGAFKVQLTPEENKEMRQACESVEILGGRYPEAMAGALFADTPPLQA